MSKETIQLKELAPYLPYGLKINILNHKCDYVGIEYSVANGFYQMAEGFYITYDGGSTGKGVDDFKPLLIPLSELPISLMAYYSHTNMDEFIQSVINGYLPYEEIQCLIEKHFDVFNLIPRNLAINKLTVK